MVFAVCAYLMLWTPLYEKAFLPWVAATTVNLQSYGVANQELGTVLAGMFGMGRSQPLNLAVAAAVAAGMLVLLLQVGGLPLRVAITSWAARWWGSPSSSAGG